MIKSIKKPEVGQGATHYVGSDRYPYTVTRVGPSGKVCWLKQDKFKRTDNNGLSEDQTYEYKPNSGAREVCAHWDGKRWVLHGSTLSIGERDAYRDPSF